MGETKLLAGVKLFQPCVACSCAIEGRKRNQMDSNRKIAMKQKVPDSGNNHKGIQVKSEAIVWNE